MKVPHGFELTENCSDCQLRNDKYFCNLQPTILKEFDSSALISAYPQGAVLFVEKQTAKGLYIVCRGQVKISISSSEGRTMILRIAAPGDILGLSAAFLGSAHEDKAEAITPCQIAFLRREEFLRLMAQNPALHQNTIRQLTSQYEAACQQLRTVGLSLSVLERLARLLLDWSSEAQTTALGTKIKMSLTHEEIAECIGVTREAVSRALREFKERRLVSVQGATLVVDRAALENFARI